MSSQLLKLVWSHFQANHFTEALRICRDELDSQPENADLWCLLGIVQRGAGQLDEAAASHRQALRLRPGFVEAQVNLANVLMSQERFDEAMGFYQEALKVRPDMAQVHNNLAATLSKQKRFEEAVASYHEAIRLCPNYPEAYNNLGDALNKLGRREEAISCIQTALRQKPDYVEAYHNLGSVLSEQGKQEEAISLFEQALQLKPDCVDTHIHMGAAFWMMKKYGEAEQSYRRALEKDPESSSAWIGLANSLSEQDRLPEALTCYDKAMTLETPNADAYHNRGQTHLGMGNLVKALADFEKSVALEPEVGKYHLGRAILWLLQGEYDKGWPEFEWRWKCREFQPLDFPQPLWDGSPLDGKTILLVVEQGLGDTIHFARYARLVQERGGEVVLACQKPLLQLLSTCPGINRLVSYKDPKPEFDVYAPLMSLPGILKTTVETIPAPIPYLKADPQLAEFWKQELCAYPGFKIGIAWQGSPTFPGDRLRSFPLRHFAPVAAIPGVHLISLQKGQGSEQIKTLPHPFPVMDLASRLDETTGPFLDTAAIMKSLDLVITADTSIAHVAGALGVPVWIALSRSADWRWLWDREDSPWYPTARLFRQTQRGNWDEVFQKIAKALQDQIKKKPPTSILAPISPGELVDRITRLEIQREQLNEDDSRAKVCRELKELSTIRDQHLRDDPELKQLVAELRSFNSTLIQREAEVRICDEKSDYGPRFVELAKEVHRASHHRSAVISRINELVGFETGEDATWH